MGKPNLFSIATKELSQDGFLTWLLRWADESNAAYDSDLNGLAQDFVRLLLGKPPCYPISHVDAGRQWERIDIWAEVNDSIAIIIEDKKGAEEHNNQLNRYLQFATDYYGPKEFEVCPVYLKTGNFSLNERHFVEGKGYKVIDRSDVLRVLDQQDVNNTILREFVEYLRHIELETNDYSSLERIRKSWYASEGFFKKIEQELLPEWCDWGFVNNQSGGFQGLWYHWNETEVFSEIYIQIENSDKSIKLVVKVAGENITCNQLYDALPLLQEFAHEEGLSLSKPVRYRVGQTSTLAIVDNAFREDVPFTMDSFMSTLHALERSLDRFCMSQR